MKKRIIFITILILLAISYLVLTPTTEAKSNEYNYSLSYTEVTVNTGDTLWSISEKYRGETNQDIFIKMIQQLNNMSHSVITEGSSLKIPQL